MMLPSPSPNPPLPALSSPNSLHDAPFPALPPIHTLGSCNETRLLLINLLYAGSLLALFLNFYVSSYSKNKGKGKGKGKGEAKAKDKAKAKGAKSPRRSKKEL